MQTSLDSNSKITNTYGRIPLYLNGVPSLKMINSAIDNIQIYNGKRFVSTVILSEMQLSNITFTRVQAVDIGDGENSILYIDGFDIGKTTNFIISNVTCVWINHPIFDIQQDY